MFKPGRFHVHQFHVINRLSVTELQCFRLQKNRYSSCRQIRSLFSVTFEKLRANAPSPNLDGSHHGVATPRRSRLINIFAKLMYYSSGRARLGRPVGSFAFRIINGSGSGDIDRYHAAISQMAIIWSMGVDAKVASRFRRHRSSTFWPSSPLRRRRAWAWTRPRVDWTWPRWSFRFVS